MKPQLPCTLLLLLAGASGTTLAALPDEALRAEMDGDWARAASLYQEATRRPEGADDPILWRKLAEARAAQLQLVPAAEAYARCADLLPGDSKAQQQASRAFAVAGQPKPALRYLRRLLDLSPDDEALQLDHVRLATWAGDYASAEASLLGLLEINPTRTDVQAELGRIRAWQGHYDEADHLFEAHLKQHPDDQAGWIDRASIATWVGDYAKAMDLLDSHDLRFAADGNAASRAARARVLAWAGRRQAALAINEPLLRSEGETLPLLFTQTLAWRLSARPGDALPWLHKVEALDDQSREVFDLRRSTMLPLRSRIGAEFEAYSDSANIDIDSQRLRAAHRFAAASWLHASAGQRHLQTPLGSAFAPISGGRSITERHWRLGLSHAFDEGLTGSVELGRSQVDHLPALSVGRLALGWILNDAWRLASDVSRERVAASPLSVSLGLHQTAWALEANWRPDLRWRAAARLQLGQQSDDNDLVRFDASVFRAVKRSVNWQWDLGMTANQTGYDHRAVGSGYYSPDRYHRVQIAAQGYWKWNDDNGVAINLASGVQRDETFRSWHGAHDASVEGVFGIFKDWELRLRGAYSDRRQAAGSFDGRSIQASFEYRF